MITIRAFAPENASTDLALPLTWGQRCHSRLHTHLPDGEVLALRLPHGTTLSHGDLLSSDDGRILRVVAAPEPLLEVRADHGLALTRAAYHLGNRHGSVEIGPDCIRLPEDPILMGMLEGLGCRVSRVQASFEPERGAYGHGHSHGHGHDSGTSDRHAPGQHIHEFA
ncbi:MAG: urease accessory protein UreE [Magnetococcales bacterium]|nr:urease accessory protein UreE [Magnetococcales bacterium]MBF0271812.1 urease accessory protein UreE [Magnetococcales bacterium]